MSNFFEVKDLEVIYQTKNEIVHAVNGINFTLNKEETLGIVGETGAGKTTTALSILRLLPERTGKVKNGEIIFDNLSLLDLKEDDMRLLRGSRIGMIFQDPMTSLNPILTIGEQIAEGIRLHSVDCKKNQVSDRVDEILELVGIEKERKKCYPHEFSGGMKQRVVIAMALSCSPDILIADEPTTALDVTIQAQVLNLIETLKKKLSMSVIMITHDLGVVAKTCDHVAVLYAGEIIEYGTLEDVFKRKENHPYTKGLFGSIPNILDNSKRLSPIQGLMPDPMHLPNGCKFHPRCSERLPICCMEEPKEYIRGNHKIKCHLFPKVGE